MKNEKFFNTERVVRSLQACTRRAAPLNARVDAGAHAEIDKALRDERVGNGSEELAARVAELLVAPVAHLRDGGPLVLSHLRASVRHCASSEIENNEAAKRRANLREVLLEVRKHRLNLRTLFAVGRELLQQLSLSIVFASLVEAGVDTVVDGVSFAIVFVVWVFCAD